MVYDDENDRKNGKVYDDQARSTGNDAASKKELARLTGSDKASNADLRSQTGADEKASLFKKEPEGDTGNSDPGSFGFRKEKLKGLANLKNKSKKLGKNKFVIGGAAAGSLLLLGLLILLFLIGAQIIPNFAQNMVAYSFARVTRETVDSNAEVTSEKIALDSAPDSVFQTAQNTFANDVDSTTNENIWSKINNYRPEKVVDNLKGSGQLYFAYGPDKSLSPVKGLLGRQTVQKIYVNGQAIDVPQNSFSTLDKILSPVDYTKSLWQSNKLLKTTLGDSLDTTFRGTNWIIRGKVAGLIREAYDIKLYRWDQKDLNQLDSETPAEADITSQQEEFQRITDQGAAATEAEAGVSGQEQQAADGANQAIDDCLQSADCTKGVIDQGGGLPSTAIDVLNNIFTNTLWDGILKLLAPTYAIAAPLCMIWQASIVNSGGVINSNAGELQRTAYQVTSAADQQKYGNVNGNAIGAQVRQMGNNSEIATSNVMRRASGIPVDTTDSGVNPQASAGGTYTYDVFSFLGPADNVIRPIIGTVCSVFDNPWSGIIIGLFTLLVPAVRAAIDAVAESAAAGIGVFVGKLATSLGSSLLKMFDKKELAKMAGIAGATIAGALLAKYIALQHVAALNNGLSRNQDYNDRAEAGAILNSQDIDRQQNMAGPMSASGTAQAKVQDMSFLSGVQQHQSTFQRYFAVSNADSFVTKLGISAWAHMNLSTIPSLVLSAGRIFNPMSALSNVFSIMQNKTLAAASTNEDTTDYNILQYGWTPIEEWHFVNDPSYSMLHNQQVLDQSGQESTINGSLMKCFTEKLGTLLANGDLQRDANTDIMPDTGDCAPNNYSPTNRDDPIASDNMVFTNAQAELAFRWRVAIRNQNALNQLVDAQNPVTADNYSANASTTATAGGCGGGKYGSLVGSGSSFAGVDQGIDFVPSGSSAFNICAPAAGTITLADPSGHIFQRTTGQTLVMETMDSAPSAPSSSKYIYYAEIITIDSNIHVGTHVNKGDLIGTSDKSPGIEVGWGTGPKNGFLCGIGYPTACGTSFNTWVQAQ